MNFESNRQVPPEWALGEVTLRCAQPGEIATARAVLARERYLGAPAPCNCDVVQPATRGEQVLAIVVWTRVAQRLAARDSWVGWDARTRVRRVPLLVQNNRFLVLASVRQPNLASRVPGLAVAALPAAWEKRHGVAPLMAETFVDPERHQGTCCKAAGWTEVGASARWGIENKNHHPATPPGSRTRPGPAPATLPRI